MVTLKTFYILLFASALFCPLKAQQSVPHLESCTEQLKKQLDTVIRNEHIPGLMVAIVKKDRILFADGIGYADLEQHRHVSPHTAFHLASITKFFVAMGVQQLVANGKIALTDRIHDIAPEIPFTNPWEATDPVRVVHLLEHTAGFSDVELNSMVNISGKPLTGLDALEAVSNSLTVRWRPGIKTSYSNPGYNVLGYLIEKVTGMSWDVYIEQTLLSPLGMDETLFDRNGQRRPQFATGYDFQNGVHRPMPFYLPSGNGAGSALVSTANDMAKFLYYLLNGRADSSLLRPEDLTEMETVHSTLAANAGLQTGYALGNDLFPNNKKVSFRGHNGKGEGFVSWVFFNREAGLAYAISANAVVNLWPVSQAIEELLTQDIEAPKLTTFPLDKDSIAPLLGHYQFTNPKNERWEFFKRIFGHIELQHISGDKLIVDKGNGQIDSLLHMGNGIFRLQGDILPYFILARDAAGRPFFQGYGNGFYRPVSYSSVLIRQVPIYLGLIALAVYFLYSCVGIILTLLRKMKPIDLFIPLLPVLGTFSFLFAFRTMGLTDASHKELFASFNWTSFSIFAGMLLFAILVISSSVLLYRRWTYFNGRWFGVLLAFSHFFIGYLVVLLVINGWIGVPIWMM
ncbi:serine hydrolase domain-containing protein [Sphingobacterium suaedae]|uniref:Serine hydrolase domain-containing protein n=1 Tax=Sphingobacterium suaedae TaxID=1686402 RepID=A0ABW5KK98_9SPHI